MEFLDIIYLYFSLHSILLIAYCSIQPLAAILNKPIIIIDTGMHLVRMI